MGSRDLAYAAETDAATRATSGAIFLACLLAWALPGAGHWFLGRRLRGAVFFGLITVCFALGVIHDGRFSVLDRRQPFLSGMQVVACLGSGPMEIAARTIVYGAPIYRLPDEDAREPGEGRRPTSVVGRTLRSRHEAYDSAFGTAYLWTAGLMNLLLVLDVFDIGIGRKM